MYVGYVWERVSEHVRTKEKIFNKRHFSHEIRSTACGSCAARLWLSGRSWPITVCFFFSCLLKCSSLSGAPLVLFTTTPSLCDTNDQNLKLILKNLKKSWRHCAVVLLPGVSCTVRVSEFLLATNNRNLEDKRQRCQI